MGLAEEATEVAIELAVEPLELVRLELGVLSRQSLAQVLYSVVLAVPR